MSRLTEVQSYDLENLVLRLQASLDELKCTPQLTSNMSGVKTYQNPDNDDWQPVRLTNAQGQVTEGVVNVPVSWTGFNTSVRVDCEFTPENQDAPIVYPFLEVSLDGVTWQTAIDTSTLTIKYTARSTNNHVDTYTNALTDDTDYSQEQLVYKYSIYAYIFSNSGTAGGSATLRFRFRTRSSDKGTTQVRVRLY